MGSIKGPKVWGLLAWDIGKDHGTGSCAEGLSYDRAPMQSDAGRVIGEGLFLDW